MKHTDKDYLYYLKTYGSDLSLWPEDILKSIDLQALQASEDYRHEEELDAQIRRAVWPGPEKDLKERVLNAIDDQAVEFPVFSAGFPWKGFQHALLVTAIMLTSLFFGIQYGHVIDRSSTGNYSHTISKIWYFGPIYAYAAIDSGEYQDG